MQQPVPDPAQLQHMMTTALPVFAFLAILWCVLLIVPFWQIFKKSGMGGALSLLMVVPLVNLVMLYVLAFSKWKVVPVAEFGAGVMPPGYPPPAAYPPGYVPAAAAYPPSTPSYVPPSDPPATI